MVLYNSSVGGRPWPPCARESAVQNTKTATYKGMDRTRFIGPPGTESSLGTGTHAGNWRFLNGFLKKVAPTFPRPARSGRAKRKLRRCERVSRWAAWVG